MHFLTQLKQMVMFLVPHFRVGLFLYTPSTYPRRTGTFVELQPGEKVVLSKEQRLVEQEYFTWLGFKGFHTTKAVHKQP